ncbi:hypothetical protein [Priestia megaterium]|uniref:hypothetical protein n=1 Tax=Priestia megaterium TaxID=1404 RepID=UPI002E238539|nr:hypothetical protein [Priestia megaterium]
MKFNMNNCNRFGQLKLALLADDRFSEHTHGKYEAAVLYAMIENQISLSQDTYENGNSKYYDEESQKCFCNITEQSAKRNFKMSSSTFKTRKKFLQEAGLISFTEQAVKKEGVPTAIFATDFTEWVEQNGLYVNGEWHVNPSSENYFNPTKYKSNEKIVKVVPKIKKKKKTVVESVEVEQEQQELIEGNLQEYERIMKEAKLLGAQFRDSKRMDELRNIVVKYFGPKQLMDATVKDLSALRSCYEQMKRKFNYEREDPDLQF